ncbi:PREDICTED: 60S acidic ribosomal protein P1-like isoform X1 [Chinchilla lanigera]|uniref:60S acidic ribosomal protein P1-like isoform X1 n=1 Tax=Chinchilla lanigera TaxID=34839 RepID=UPI00038EA9E0|nr:PREDICTED: 60S acidic ribosomal protein P1-like isoform X1 [Chinchilla lanigera]
MAPSSLHHGSISELAGVYSAFILHKDNEVTFTGDTINALIKAAGVHVKPFRPGLFSKALANVNIGSLICNVGAGGPAPAASAAPAGGPTPSTLLPQLRRRWKQKEESEESEENMGFGLFD